VREGQPNRALIFAARRRGSTVENLKRILQLRVLSVAIR
jgi:hypothetical protein